MNTDVLTDLSKRFLFHADIYSGKTPENSSPLYAHLARCVAQDEEILQLLIQADRATQVSNLLSGAIHYLLLQGINHPLSQYYISLTENPRPAEDVFTEFQAFCRKYANTITDIVIRKRVQTNEVQRCTALVPAFHLVQQRYNNQPLAIIEIGASIGLLLQWDKYNYDYGQVGAVQTNSVVNLFCHVIGIQTPPLPTHVPEVGYRIGIDLHPVNVNDEDAVQWVRALIWPEHSERARVFTQAVTIT
jgi:hypothetical protein